MASAEDVPRPTGPAASEGHEELVRLADLTLAEFMRHIARCDGTTVEEDGLLLFAGPHPQPSPFRNGALCLDRRLPADEVLRRGRAFFSARRRGFVMWVREHGDDDLAEAIEHLGLRELERIPGMVLDHLPPERPLPDGMVLRRALDEQTRSDLLRVNADAWGLEDMPLDTASDVFFHPDIAAAPNAAAFVVYADGAPVACSMAFASNGVALGCEGATVKAARGNGLAHITQRAAVKICMEEMGAKRTFAQTSEAGLPVWLSFGFVPFTAFRRFVVPVAGSSPGG